MDFENNIPKVDVESEKEKRLAKLRIEVDTITDGLGEKIDAGIKEAVIYCRALGLATDASCEGHVSRDDMSWNHLPYIAFEAPDRPGYIYEGQKEIFERIAKENGITVDNLRREEKYETLLASAWDEIGAHPQLTSEYEQWVEQQSLLFDRVKNILEEFYQDRTVELEKKLIIAGNKEAFFKVINHGGVHEDGLGDGFLYQNYSKTKAKEAELVSMVSDFQAEIEAFTEFLKDKFLKS
jgi:hypothetical protein